MPATRCRRRRCPPAGSNRAGGCVEMRPRPALTTSVATVGFGLSFWAWILLVPLEPDFRTRFGLGPTAQALLLAVPVLVGSLGRIPVGVLVDRYGPGVLVPTISLVTAFGVCALAFVDSLPALIVAGALLGTSGTTFAAGVPLVAGATSGRRRRLAIGLFGGGLVGSAACAVTSQSLYELVGRQA